MKYLRKQNCQLFKKTLIKHKGMNGNAKGCSYLWGKSSRAAHSHLPKALT
jgi:hypothetical protein